MKKRRRRREGERKRRRAGEYKERRREDEKKSSRVLMLLETANSHFWLTHRGSVGTSSASGFFFIFNVYCLSTLVYSSIPGEMV